MLTNQFFSFDEIKNTNQYEIIYKKAGNILIHQLNR